MTATPTQQATPKVIHHDPRAVAFGVLGAALTFATAVTSSGDFAGREKFETDYSLGTWRLLLIRHPHRTTPCQRALFICTAWQALGTAAAVLTRSVMVAGRRRGRLGRSPSSASSAARWQPP
ncbi:MAG: hypothetical protein ACXV5Q_13625, partial [Frankiaceae bacterium]